MSRLLLLTHRMRLGFGVDLVVHEIAERIAACGHSVAVLCIESDATFRGSYDVIRLRERTVNEVQRLAEEFQPDRIVACTTPFFEMLPVLRHRFPCWAWEFGDPTPELFTGDSEERQTIKRNKIEFCYPIIHGVVAISEFVRADIEWLPARVLYLGCDHAPDLGSKGLDSVSLDRRRPLRIGTLMRLGRGESAYKGNRLFLQLAETMSGGDHRMEFCVMGRGRKVDAEEFTRAGCSVFLNASDQEKWNYLRNLDVFVSCSLWEGFNLPLVEAQAMGTLGLALDTGAHPEVCPQVFPSLAEMAAFLEDVSADRGLLLRHSRAAYHFVRRMFRWDQVALGFLELVLGAPARSALSGREASRRAPARGSGLGQNVAAMMRSLRYEGMQSTARKLWRRVR